MKQIILVSISMFLLFGCAKRITASDIMMSYVAHDIRDVVVDYGPPRNAFDMGDGRRAFQWVISNSRTTPTYASTSGSISGSSSYAWINTNTRITGGQTIISKCIYTLFAEWNEHINGWWVVDFRSPPRSCE